MSRRKSEEQSFDGSVSTAGDLRYGMSMIEYMKMPVMTDSVSKRTGGRCLDFQMDVVVSERAIQGARNSLCFHK